jgi:hypothetical protein
LYNLDLANGDEGLMANYQLLILQSPFSNLCFGESTVEEGIGSLVEKVWQEVPVNTITEFLSREEIYLGVAKSKNDLKIHHQIYTIYEKIAGKDILIHIALQGA